MCIYDLFGLLWVVQVNKVLFFNIRKITTKTCCFFTGSQNDATVFNYSDLNQLLASSSANLPPDEIFSNFNIPYHLLGDGGLPLKKYLMVPYARGPYTPYSETIFNRRLSAARSTIERAFGLLSNKWKILQQAMNFKLETTSTIVMALVCLHNFIITQEQSNHSNKSYASSFNEANFRLDNLNPDVDGDSDNAGLQVRANLTQYLVSRQGQRL